MAKLRTIAAPLDRYLALRDLMAHDARAYYSLLLSHTEEILPFVYTVRLALLSSRSCTLGRSLFRICNGQWHLMNCSSGGAIL